MMNFRRRTLPFALLILLSVFTAACGSDSAAKDSGSQITVVATTTQVADLTRNVVGDRAKVVQLLDPETEAHDFEPAASDLAALADADLIVANGVGLDDWIARLRKSSGSSARIVDTSEGVEILTSRDGAEDPHIWMDPRNAIHMTKRIRDAVMNADPANAATYRANTTAFVEELDALDDELRAQIARIPLAQRRIVTDHDAFRYLADRYRITIVGSALPSLVAGAEPNARDMTELAERIRNQGVRVLFAEAAVDPAVAQALADEAGIKVAGVLWGDSLGAADSNAATYVAMMRSNMTVLVDGMLDG